MLKLFGILTVLAAIPALADPQSTPLAAPVIPAVICHSEGGYEDGKDAPTPPATAILAGYGTGGFRIAANAEARAYFDNGMQLAHAFAHKPATSAFIRAEQLDPTCAMCVWGEAWSRGPTINFGIDDKDRKAAAALADKAAALGRDASPKDKAMIGALQKRYRKGGDDAFAHAMDEVAKGYPDDNEIAVIAADAWMIAANDANRKANLDRAMVLLEGALVRNPNDTGAIHFYIHATENNGVGTKALPYAEKLEALAPAASHLVHMPSHTFFWAGRYQMAEQSNLDALTIDKATAERLKPKGGVFGLSYHGHNVQYGEAGALMDGDAKGGLSLASAELGELKGAKPGDTWQQVGLGTAFFVYGRYATPTAMAALPEPGAKLPYAEVMWRYAKGEAAVRCGDVAAVKAQAAALHLSPADLKLLKDFRENDAARVEIARLVLIGRAAMMEKRWADAQAAYRRAAEVQEDKFGSRGDPPAWWYPVRRSLAVALLADGKPGDAAKEIQAVLLRWPYDPVSLRIQADCATATGHAEEAKRDLAYAASNWKGDVSALPLSAL